MHRWFKSGTSQAEHCTTLLFLLVLSHLTLAQSYTQQSAAPIKVDVGLVNLSVAVTDRNGQTYSGLSPSNFRIYENGVEQPIHHFSHDDLPYSMGLVLDRSGSMAGMIRDVYDAAFHTVRASKAEDEFFIEVFNDQVEVRQKLTTDQALLQRQLKRVTADSSTALFDAILVGLDELKKARHDKKALLVVTDGDDNSSDHSFQEVLERARAEDVVIYVVGMFDRKMFATDPRREDRLRALLSQLAEVTGGRAYFPQSVKQCEEACIAIAKDLREQYSLGYYPSPKVLDGSWRAIRIQLSLPEELSKDSLTARTRSGYFGPRP